MLGFILVHVPEHCVSGFVEELLLIPLVEFAQAAADGSTLLVRQLGQLGENLGCAHGRKVTLALLTRKPGFGSTPCSPLKDWQYLMLIERGDICR